MVCRWPKEIRPLRTRLPIGTLSYFAAREAACDRHRHRLLLRSRHYRPRRRASKDRNEFPPPHWSSSRPLHRQPIPAEDAWERATSRLGADLVIEPRGGLLRRIGRLKVAWVVWAQGENAHRTPMDIPIAAEIIRTIESVRGSVIKIPSSGATGPDAADTVLGMPSIRVPIVNHDNNQHSFDENLRLQNLWDGIEVRFNTATPPLAIGRARTLKGRLAIAFSSTMRFPLPEAQG